MAAGKKTVQRKPAAKGASRKDSGAQGSSGRSSTPVLVLIILILLTAMVVIINRTERGGGKRKTDPVAVKKHDDTKAGADDKKVVAENENRDKKEEEKKDDAPATRIVQVYFIKINDTTEKISLVPVKRTVNEDTYMKDTLEELMRGPSSYEKKRGYITAIPGNLRLRNVLINKGAAVLDFTPSLGEGAAGDILISRLDQIVYTATQFKDVRSVEITINGSRQKTLGADGLSISGPLHRRK